jgi:hypothetical protein
MDGQLANFGGGTAGLILGTGLVGGIAASAGIVTGCGDER